VRRVNLSRGLLRRLQYAARKPVSLVTTISSPRTITNRRNAPPAPGLFFSAVTADYVIAGPCLSSLLGDGISKAPPARVEIGFRARYEWPNRCALRRTTRRPRPPPPAIGSPIDLDTSDLARKVVITLVATRHLFDCERVPAPRTQPPVQRERRKEGSKETKAWSWLPSHGGLLRPLPALLMAQDAPLIRFIS
jgi:hypothetical protein